MCQGFPPVSCDAFGSSGSCVLPSPLYLCVPKVLQFTFSCLCHSHRPTHTPSLPPPPLPTATPTHTTTTTTTPRSFSRVRPLSLRSLRSLARSLLFFFRSTTRTPSLSFSPHYARHHISSPQRTLFLEDTLLVSPLLIHPHPNPHPASSTSSHVLNSHCPVVCMLAMPRLAIRSHLPPLYTPAVLLLSNAASRAVTSWSTPRSPTSAPSARTSS